MGFKHAFDEESLLELSFEHPEEAASLPQNNNSYGASQKTTSLS